MVGGGGPADRFGRAVRNLRISVTDRCSFRCFYCMPSRPRWLARRDILTFEEILRVTRIAAGLGIRNIRLTGGEPTARGQIEDLVCGIAAIPDVADLSLTTNGYRLKELARPLRDAGLRRINVSLDSLSPECFARIALRDALPRVWEGILEADQAGFRPLKINTVVIRGLNDGEILDFADLARRYPWEIRFIEFMPLDGDGRWSPDQVVPAAEILDRIGSVWPLEAEGIRGPARSYRFRDGAGRIAVIASVTRPFCDSCNRIRLTADGRLVTCLFSRTFADLKPLLRGGADDAEVAQRIVTAIAEKGPGHQIGRPEFQPPPLAMNRIGG